MARPTRLRLAFAVALVGLSLAPSVRANHEPIQILGQDPTSSVMVGLDSAGTATAVWSEAATIRYATRPLGEFFGVPRTLGSGAVSEFFFDESSNGNAAIVWSGNITEGKLLVSVRLGPDAPFSTPQVIMGPSSQQPADARVAVSNSGRAAIVWKENAPTQLIRAALSDNSGVFGTPITLASGPPAQNPVIGVDGAGAAIAVWDDANGEIRLASAPASGSFGAPTTIEALEQGPGMPDVAVNGSGQAVVVWEDFTSAAQCAGLPVCSSGIVEASYGDVSGTFGRSQEITDPGTPTASLGCEAAIDTSGAAGVICSLTPDGVYGVYVSISDPSGVFGGLQAVSPREYIGGPGVGRTAFELAAGGGEFTAFWANDHDGDGVLNEAWTASTSGGVFGAAHQMSPESTEDVGIVHGARDDGGRAVGTWILRIDSIDHAQVSPAAPGVPPIYGTEHDDDLDGTENDDLVALLGGNDTFRAGGGNDSVDGGAGSDDLDGGSGDDLLTGAGGGDNLVGADGTDVLKGGGGKDVLDGGRGKDKLIGGKGRDTCYVTKGDKTKGCERVVQKRHRFL